MIRTNQPAPGPWYASFAGNDNLYDVNNQHIANFDGYAAESWPELTPMERIDRDGTNMRLVEHMWGWLSELTEMILEGEMEDGVLIPPDMDNFETLVTEARRIRREMALPDVHPAEENTEDGEASE